MSLISYTITNSGGTLNTNFNYSYVINAPTAVTLTSSFSIVPLNPLVNNVIKIRWNASVTLATYSITIAGINVPQDQVNQTGTFELVWDGTLYYLQYFPDFTERPQETFGVTTVTVPSGGGTLTINPGTDTRTYLLQGTTTLTSNYTVNGNTNPTQVTNGSSIRVVLGGGITIGSNTVTIFGETISAYDCLIGGAEVYAEFDSTSSSYVATYVNRDIPLDKLLTTGFVLGDNGKLVMYDHATKKFVKNFLSAANLSSNFKAINITKTDISSSQILTLFTTPVTILPASGSLTTFEAPLMILVRYKQGSTAYTTNVDCRFASIGPNVTNTLADKIGMLSFTTTGVDIITINDFNLTGPEILLEPNAAIQIGVTGGNPLVGDGDITVYVISTTLEI
jgi:hypothetical protein